MRAVRAACAPCGRRWRLPLVVRSFRAVPAPIFRAWAPPAMLLGALLAVPCRSAAPQGDAGGRIAIVYTGRSLGALGAVRAQEEHELLTEQALTEHRDFALVSHVAWRAPGIVVFLPSSEPQGDELADILARRAGGERRTGVRALVGANGLLFQDPWRPEPDLMAMLERNPRRRADFADLVETQVTVTRLRTARDARAFIVELPGATWPPDLKGWTTGEANRVDVEESRLFELPLNLGEMGPRATILQQVRDDATHPTALTLTVDLGHRDGDVGLPRAQRALVDFAALRGLDYSVVVPYDFELSLGADGLGALAAQFTDLTLLAANVRAADTTLLRPWMIVGPPTLRVGLVGLVHPAVRDHLPRAALSGFTFEDPLVAVRRAVAALRAAGVAAIVVLSNMDAGDNGRLAGEVQGVDAIVADLQARSAPEAMRVRVDLPDRPYARPGPPALVARSGGDGARVGRLDLEFRDAADGTPYLTALEHRVTPVTDRTLPDTVLVRHIAALAERTIQPRGELLVPAFSDILERHPGLGAFDAITRQGRISKAMWEAFMARRLRVHGSAEVAVIRRLDQFPPLVGKLHEREVDAWLWTQDEVVLVDLPGSDLKALLRDDGRGELATSGIDPRRLTVLGRPIEDATFYRVATTDVIYEGARGRYFARARRVRRRFVTAEDGALVARATGTPVALRTMVLDDLKRARQEARGDEQVDRVALLLAPDPPFVNLLSFVFDRPTLFTSLSQASNRDAYSQVPESRITAPNAFVLGGSGRFVLTQDRPRWATDLGLSLAYARQRTTAAGTITDVTTSDDITLDLTLRPSSQVTTPGFHPFVRGLFNTQFSPPTDPATGLDIARRLALRAVGGLRGTPTPTIRRSEIGLAVENDFARPNVQVGLVGRLDFERGLSPAGDRRLYGRVVYRWTNDVTYLFPTGRDTDANLALRYNMVHEVLVPLVDELSLSMAADILIYQGKVATTRTPGMSSLLRVGLTYDRLWKPRYQPFF